MTTHFDRYKLDGVSSTDMNVFKNSNDIVGALGTAGCNDEEADAVLTVRQPFVVMRGRSGVGFPRVTTKCSRSRGHDHLAHRKFHRRHSLPTKLYAREFGKCCCYYNEVSTKN